MTTWFYSARLETRAKESNISGGSTCLRNECDCYGLCTSRQPRNLERFEYEHICQDPKHGEYV